MPMSVRQHHASASIRLVLLLLLLQCPIPTTTPPCPPSQTCVEFEQRVTYLAHATPTSLWEDVTAVYRPVTV